MRGSLRAEQLPQCCGSSADDTGTLNSRTLNNEKGAVDMAVPVVRRVSRGNVWWNTLGKAVAG